MKIRKITAGLTAFLMLAGQLPANDACVSLVKEAVVHAADEVRYTPEEYFTFDKETGFITKYDGPDTEVVIPSEINGVTVKGIGSFAFGWNSSITAITIPDTVEQIEYSAFYYDRSLTSVNIPDSVYFIGEGAFQGCSSLESVTLNSRIEEIKGRTFAECTALTSVIIPESVKSIGRGAFEGCSSLESAAVPSAVELIDENTFYGCTNLKKISLPDSVKEIGGMAFWHCISLESVIIPDSTEKIDYAAFSGCTELREVTVPSSVKSIGYNAFKDTAWLNSGLEEVGMVIVNGMLIDGTGSSGRTEIPYGVTSVCDMAFQDCRSITEVIIPDTVKEIGSRAFSGCRNISDVYISESVEKIGYSAFAGTEWLNGKINTDTYVVVNGILIDCDKTVENAVIPEGVKCIAREAFNSSNVVSIDIPYGLEKIESYAVSFCSSLESITFENDAEIIEDYAIYYNPSLVINGHSGTNISRYAAANSIPFHDVNTEIQKSGSIGEGFTWELDDDGTVFVSGTGEMPDFTEETAPFAGNYTFRKVVFDAGITHIGSWLFSGCSRLGNIVFPSTLRSAGDAAFKDTKCTKVVLPDGFERAGDNAFSSESLSVLIIPESVSYLGMIGSTGYECSVFGYRGTYAESFASSNNLIFRAFDINENISWSLDADGTAEITGTGAIPADDSTFRYASFVNEVRISEGITALSEGAFQDCYSLTKVTLPSTVSVISSRAFNYCTTLKEINITDSITGIENDAFGYCGLREVTLPESVEYIGSSAFMGCGSLERIEILNPECDICDEKYTITNHGYPMGVGPGVDWDEIERNIKFDGVIAGYDGSTAEEYANRYGYRFESLGRAPVKYKNPYTYYSNLEEFRNFGFVTDSTVIDSSNIFSPVLINPVKQNDEFAEAEFMFRNHTELESLTVVNGSTYFNYNSVLNFSDGDKLIVYGDLKLEQNLDAVTESVTGTELWNRPSLMCTGNIYSPNRIKIGSKENPVNIYCGSMTASLNQGCIYGNVLYSDADRESTVNGEVYGNLFSSGSVTVNAPAYIDGDLIVKDNLNLGAPLKVNGRIYVEGAINGNISNLSCGERAESCSDMVFDPDSSDLLTFEDLTENGINNTGVIVPPAEVFENIYLTKQNKCSSLYEKVMNKADVSSFPVYNGAREISGSVYIPAAAASALTSREVYIYSADGSPVYIALDDNIEMINTKFIVDDYTECWFILGKNGADLTQTRIEYEKYDRQLSEGRLNVSDSDEINIRIVGPDGSSLRAENSVLTAHLYVQVSRFERGYSSPVIETVYNNEVKNLKGNYTALIGSYNDCRFPVDNAAQDVSFGGVFYVKDSMADESPARFIGASLTLTDGINFNYRFRADSSIADGATAVFRSSVFEKSFESYKWVSSGKTDEYLVSIPVRPDCLTDEITSEIYDSEGNLLTSFTYTVKEYLDSILENEEWSVYHELCTAMLRYGAATQEYTGFMTDKPAFDFEKEPVYPAVSDNRFRKTVSRTGDSVRAKSASVKLGANTVISIKFTVPENSDLNITCTDPQNGIILDTETEIIGNTVTVNLKDIRPQDYDAMYQFTAECGDDSAVVDYSVNSYILEMAEKESTDTAFGRLLSVMYDYGIAADNLWRRLVSGYNL